MSANGTDQFERPFHEDENLYRRLFETIPQGVAYHEMVFDENGAPKDYRFLAINPAFSAATGLKPENVIGKTVSEVLPNIEEYWIRTYGKVATSGEAIHYNNYSGDLDKYFEVVAFSPAYGQFVTVLFERQTTEALLTKQLNENQALLSISQSLAGVVDLPATLNQIADAASTLIKTSSRTILHLLDDSGNFLQPVAVSGSGGPMAGRMNFKLGEGVAGIALQTSQTINIRDVLDDERYLAPSYVQGRPRSLLVTPVKTGEKNLGTLSVQSPDPKAFSADDERLLTILGTQAALAIEKAQLLTDLRISLDHEKAARAQLVQSEKLSALGRIVASVAHELNNPLQAIQNALYLVQMEENLSQQAHEDIKTILTEVDRMTDMISRLKETYRPVVKEQFAHESLNQLVNEVQKLLSTHLRRNQVEFRFVPDDFLPDVPMIRDQIKQVILNVSLNAVEAMNTGGVLIIQTRFDAATEGAIMSITDNGPGISPKVVPYIFDPFITTKESGTGLGLSISFDIVRRHNGRIEVSSEPGKGTTFTIWLPLQQSFEALSMTNND